MEAGQEEQAINKNNDKTDEVADKAKSEEVQKQPVDQAQPISSLPVSVTVDDEDKQYESGVNVTAEKMDVDNAKSTQVESGSNVSNASTLDAGVQETLDSVEPMITDSPSLGSSIGSGSSSEVVTMITDENKKSSDVKSEMNPKESNVEPAPAPVASSSGSIKVSSVAPGVKDSDGFLAPPPASTLLIRRARVSSTGATTYVVTSGPGTKSTSSGAIPDNSEKQKESQEKPVEERPVRRRPGRPVGSVCKYKKRKTSESEGVGELRTSTRVSSSGFGGDDEWVYPTAFRVSHFSAGKPPMTGYHQPYSKDNKKNSSANIDPLTGKRRYNKRKKLGIEKKHHKEVESPEPEEAPGSTKHLSDNGIWRPTDDLRLIVNTLATGDLESVHSGVKFSCFFTYKDIEERWRKLMYGEKSSLVAQNAIAALHPYVKARIEYESLFSPEEEKLIASVKSVPDSNPSINSFQTLLDENPQVFNKYRTARRLLMHWLDMEDFHLLPHQRPQDYKPARHIENFEDYSLDFDDDDDIEDREDESIQKEQRIEDRRLKKKIRKLEDEITSWQLLTDQIIDDGMKDRTLPPLPTDFDNKTYALLRGKEVNYGMASREIVLGRSTKDNKVDANLTEEGSCSKISRKQAVIRLKDMGRFVIINKGRLPIFIDKKAVLYRCAARLHDQSVIQIADVNLVFFINEPLIERIVEQDVRREIYASFKDLEKDMPPMPPPIPYAARSPTFPGPSTSSFLSSSQSSMSPTADSSHIHSPGRVYQYHQPPKVGSESRKDEPVKLFNPYGIEKRSLPISPLVSCVNDSSSSITPIVTVNPPLFQTSLTRNINSSNTSFGTSSITAPTPIP